MRGIPSLSIIPLSTLQHSCRTATKGINIIGATLIISLRTRFAWLILPVLSSHDLRRHRIGLAVDRLASLPAAAVVAAAAAAVYLPIPSQFHASFLPSINGDQPSVSKRLSGLLNYKKRRPSRSKVPISTIIYRQRLCANVSLIICWGFGSVVVVVLVHAFVVSAPKPSLSIGWGSRDCCWCSPILLLTDCYDAVIDAFKCGIGFKVSSLLHLPGCLTLDSFLLGNCSNLFSCQYSITLV